MATFRRCDRCAQEHANYKPKALYVVDGKRQGLMGPIPAIVDLCNDCRVYTNDGHFCEHCCSSGYSYAAVTALTESNYRMRKALADIRDYIDGGREAEGEVSQHEVAIYNTAKDALR